MTTLISRTICAMLSLSGAAGLVAFVDPATTAPHAKAATVIAASAPAATAARG